MKILNLTQHEATAEQVAAGVVEPENKERIQELLTFSELPDAVEINIRAMEIGGMTVAAGVHVAMLGGAPYLMSALEKILIAHDIQPVYSFTKRESIEVKQPDGSVRKTQVFRHVGFVEVV